MAFFGNKHFWNFTVMVCGCLLLAACSAGVGTLKPTLTPEPSQTSAPTETVIWFPATATKINPTGTPEPALPTLNVLPPEEVFVDDDFSEETLWQTQNETDAKISFEPNALSMVISGNKGEAISLSKHELPSDFYLTFTIETSLCTEDDQYGIIFWRNSTSGTFRLWASCKGQLMVDRVLPDGITRMVNWQGARKLVPGAPARNVFSIRAEKGNVDIFVNDTYQFSFQVRDTLEGGLGVIARAAGDGDLSIRFSELIISKPAP